MVYFLLFCIYTNAHEFMHTLEHFSLEQVIMVGVKILPREQLIATGSAVR